MKCSLRQITARAVVALTASAVLASCSPTEVGVSKLDNYVKRLSTASKTPVSDVASARITKPPGIDELPGEDDADTLTLIDFLALSGCKLQANIAKRNTTMGRNASVSQRLIFDLEFIRLAPACIDKLRSDEDHEIANLLEVSLVSRTESLVHTLARGVLGGSEWREFWRIPDSLGEYPLQSSGDTAQSLWELSQRVKRFLDGTWSPSDEDLEPLLAKVRVNAGGQLLRAAMIQARGLTEANRILRHIDRSIAVPFRTNGFHLPIHVCRWPRFLNVPLTVMGLNLNHRLRLISDSFQIVLEPSVQFDCPVHTAHVWHQSLLGWRVHYMLECCYEGGPGMGYL